MWNVFYYHCVRSNTFKFAAFSVPWMNPNEFVGSSCGDQKRAISFWLGADAENVR